jgi:hypothetical protein
MNSILPKDNSEPNAVVVRRARVVSLDLYEIKEEELIMFEKGSPADLQLNFGIFLLSLSFSAIVALSTATFTYPIVRTTYVVVSVVGILFGGYLLVAWKKNHAASKDICMIIRQRMKDVLEEKPRDASSDALDAPKGL